MKKKYTHWLSLLLILSATLFLQISFSYGDTPSLTSSKDNDVAFLAAGPQQFSASAITIIAPSCALGSPGYFLNASFTINVKDATACAGTYTVHADPVVGSGPGGSTPPSTTTTTYIGFPQGNFLFAHAGPGKYKVTITNTGVCTPAKNPVIVNVIVPDGGTGGICNIDAKQFTASATPVCASGGLGGSFTVHVTNAALCPGSGTYTIHASPAVGSGPGGSTPPNTITTTYIGFPQGSFLFAQAGAGTYVVTVTQTGGGCGPPTNPVIFVVTVPDKPTPTAGTTTPSICVSSTIQLSASGGSNYTWSGPSGFSSTEQNPSRANSSEDMDGIYTVAVSNGTCIGTATTSVQVTNPPTTLSSNSPVLVGLVINLKTATIGQGYTWKGPDAWTSNLKDPSRGSAKLTMSGVYTLSVKFGSACIATNTISVKVVPKSTREAAVEELSLERGQAIDMEINAYPNPVTNKLTVEVRLKEPSKLSLSLFNSIGKSSGTWQLNEESTYHKTELNLSELMGGVYLLQAQADKQKVVKRIVKIQH